MCLSPLPSSPFLSLIGYSFTCQSVEQIYKQLTSHISARTHSLTAHRAHTQTHNYMLESAHIVRQARTNTHLRLMTMDIMYEPVHNKANTLTSQCIFVRCLCLSSVLFCSIRSVVISFSIWRFMCFHFSLLLWFLPNVDTSHEFIPIKLFVLFVFTRFSLVCFIRLLFVCCLLFRLCFLLFIVTCFHWKSFSSLFRILSNRHSPPSFHS